MLILRFYLRDNHIYRFGSTFTKKLCGTWLDIDSLYLSFIIYSSSVAPYPNVLRAWLQMKRDNAYLHILPLTIRSLIQVTFLKKKLSTLTNIPTLFLMMFCSFVDVNSVLWCSSLILCASYPVL